MRRAILVALGTSAIIGSAAALGIGSVVGTAPGTMTGNELEYGFHRSHSVAREAQRARIDARYQVSREKCAGVSGYSRDSCLVAAHAQRGRALLQSQAPYESRN